MFRTTGKAGWVHMLGSASCAALVSMSPTNVSAADPESFVGLETVTVTAQRRAENSQTVPIAISTISGLDAENRGAVTIDTLNATVPGLVTTGSSGTSIFIRGLGNTSASPNNEPSAATYIDSVYIPSISGLHGYSFNNIERLEVLKGPQGTLFGRNATAGVVQIITPDPKQEFSGKFGLGYANYDTMNAQAYLTGGLSDNLAADLAVIYEDQSEGWGRNLTTGEDMYRQETLAIRSKWLYTPTDATRVTVSLDYSDFWSDSGTQMLPGSFAADGVTTYPGRFNAVGDQNENSHEQYGASVKVEHDFGSLHGVSITAYRNISGYVVLDNDRTPERRSYVQSYNDSDYVMQEFHLGNRDPHRVTWLAGVFLYGNTVRGTDPRIETGTAVNPDQYREIFGRQKSRSYSAFGQTTIEIVEATKLTLGLRYTDEKLKADGRFENRAGNIINGPFYDEIDFNPWTWRIALDHQFTSDVLGYVSYNRGFKSGGYNLNTPGSAPFFPETVDAYEIGLKSEFFDHRVRLNLAAFYYDYKDIQVTIVPGGAGQIFTNAAAARNYGLDGSLDFAATDHLTLSLGFGLLSAEYTDYPDARGFSITGAGFQIPNARGNDLSYSPPVSGFVSANYRRPTSIGEFIGAVSLSYTDKSYVGPDNGLARPAYELLSASVEWRSNSASPIGVRLWGRNLTDSYYATNRISSSNGWYQILAAPREYGLMLLKQF